MKSKFVIESIKRLMLLSFSSLICVPAIAQQATFTAVSAIPAGIFMLPTSLTSIIHNSEAITYKLKDQTAHQNSASSQLGFVYKIGQVDSLHNDAYQQTRILTSNYLQSEINQYDQGLDISLSLVSNNYSAGISFIDINEPEYKYGALETKNHACNNLSGIALENCSVAQDTIALSRLNTIDMYLAKALATLSASTWFGDDVTWGFHTSIDLNDRDDTFGEAYQWAIAGASVQLNNSLVPELRVGYTKNLAGNELSYYSVGITFLKHAQLDMGWRDESLTNSENSAPRSAYFSFAIETKF